MSYFGPAATNVPFLLQRSKIMLPFKNKREKGPNNLSRYLLLSFLSVAGNCSYGIFSMPTYYQASRVGWVRCDYFQGIEIEGISWTINMHHLISLFFFETNLISL